jgi:hypothetical protein
MWVGAVDSPAPVEGFLQLLPAGNQLTNTCGEISFSIALAPPHLTKSLGWQRLSGTAVRCLSCLCTSTEQFPVQGHPGRGAV